MCNMFLIRGIWKGILVENSEFMHTLFFKFNYELESNLGTVFPFFFFWIEFYFQFKNRSTEY